MRTPKQTTLDALKRALSEAEDNVYRGALDARNRGSVSDGMGVWLKSWQERETEIKAALEWVKSCKE